MQRRTIFFLLGVLPVALRGAAGAQSAGVQSPAQGPQPRASVPTLHTRAPGGAVGSNTAGLPTVNGRPYQRPTLREQFRDYLRDSYGGPAFVRSGVRTLYAEATDKPSGWGQDPPGFMQRFGSNVAITAIDGNVRFGMEAAFHEDLRYIPCHGCSVKRKLENALLSEVTARHDTDGHRFFTLTPAVADFSGPIIANAWWYPNHDPFGGVVATRTVAATRVGQHLFAEFVLERRHRDRKIEDNEPLSVAPKNTATASH